MSGSSSTTSTVFLCIPVSASPLPTRQTHREARPFLVCRTDLARAGMGEDDLLADVQAESEPARLVLLAILFAAERLEDDGQYRRRDGPRALHLAHHFLPGMPVGDPRRRSRPRAVREGVADQVREELHQPVPVPRPDRI